MEVPKNVIDKELYKRVKEEIMKKIPKHSAYRSGLIVKTYKARGGRYRGDKQYDKGISRWFREKWESQAGNDGYKKKGDIFRPTVRVTKDTPTTFNELTPTQIYRAQEEKRKTGRVTKFDK